MNIQWNKAEEEEVRLLNGRFVMQVLDFFNYNATEQEIVEHIIASTGQPPELVKQEVKRILRCGISNGFITKHQDSYSLPNEQTLHEVDADKEFRCEEVDKDDEIEVNQDEFRCEEVGKDDEIEVNQDDVASNSGWKIHIFSPTKENVMELQIADDKDDEVKIFVRANESNEWQISDEEDVEMKDEENANDVASHDEEDRAMNKTITNECDEDLIKVLPSKR